MLTQCPHCQTLFRIRDEQLRIASGRVRCSQCHQVFNAMDSLQQASTDQSDPDAAGAAEIEGEEDWVPLSSADNLTQDSLGLERDQKFDTASLHEGLVDSELQSYLEQDDGLASEPDYFATPPQGRSTSLPDSDPSSLLPLEEAPADDSDISPTQAIPDMPPSQAPRKISPTIERRQSVREKVDSELLMGPQSPEHDRRPASLSSYTAKLKDVDPAQAVVDPAPAADTSYPIDQMFEREPVNFAAVAWGLGSLLLAFALVLQLAWHYRDQVIHKAAGRHLLTQLCSVLDCTVPQRRDTEKIKVEYRDLRVHPRIPEALLLQLQMVNRASFAQPYPKLHLSLFNDEEKLVADRIFQPGEYLPATAAGQSLMASAQILRVNLELQDPGKEVTGFKFEFL